MQARSFLQWNRWNCHGLANLPASPPENELTWLTPISLQLELDDHILECDVLDKVDLSGCAKWELKDQQNFKGVC